MSKPIVRVVFSILIALVLVAGVYTSVHGLLLNAGTMSKQVGASAHLSLNSSFNRTSIQTLDQYGVYTYPYGRSEHDCGSESDYDPADD